MASVEAVPGQELRLRRLAGWFDTESAAMVTILLGLFQLLLSASLAYTSNSPPKLFIMTLVLGIIIVAGGSLVMANERNPNRLLLQGCACSNVVGLGMALLAFCLYCYSFSQLTAEVECPDVPDNSQYYYDHSYFQCPPEHLRVYSSSVTLLLILYDSGAVVMHTLLSASALRSLKQN